MSKESQKIYSGLVQTGVLDETEVPFDESENAAPDVQADQLPHTLVLGQPVMFGKDRVTEIVFQNYPTAGVCMHLPALNTEAYKMGHFVPIIAYCCGLPDALIKQLNYQDYRRALEIVVNFMHGGGE
jgi:hypothetical protein